MAEEPYDLSTLDNGRSDKGEVLLLWVSIYDQGEMAMENTNINTVKEIVWEEVYWTPSKVH